ncbi:MAG: lytic transglycosylase domain-containing protein [Bacteroidota bacterium]
MKRTLLIILTLGFISVGLLFPVWKVEAETPGPKSDATLKALSGKVSAFNYGAPLSLEFAGETVDIQNPRIEKKINREIRKSLNYPAATKLLLKRAYRYQDRFMDILEAKGIPSDFFYLSIAESKLSNATSAVGAKGFWQFMPATARQYGLEVSDQVDERLHPDKATYAAARFLKAAHKQLGEWTLVAAAYNMGPTGVERAVKNNGTRDYFQMDLNPETGAYLYRILGYKSVLEGAERYGFDLDEIEYYHPIPYRTTLVKENIDDLATFAQSHGSTYRDLKIMNPWLLTDRLTVSEGESYEIRFPIVSNPTAYELRTDR